MQTLVSWVVDDLSQTLFFEYGVTHFYKVFVDKTVKQRNFKGKYTFPLFSEINLLIHINLFSLRIHHCDKRTDLFCVTENSKKYTKTNVPSKGRLCRKDFTVVNEKQKTTTQIRLIIPTVLLLRPKNYLTVQQSRKTSPQTQSIIQLFRFKTRGNNWLIKEDFFLIGYWSLERVYITPIIYDLTYLFSHTYYVMQCQLD